MNWDLVKNNTKTAHKDQQKTENNGIIGIGTNGETVDMDLWIFEFDEITQGYGLNYITAFTKASSSGISSGFIPKTIDDWNNIIIPQYISKDNGETWVPVTNLDWTFYQCTELKEIKTIPTTVKSMRFTFRGCTNLEKVGNIPESVTNIRNIFHGCSSLIKIGNISSNVTVMNAAFQGCEKIEKLENLPNNVEDMTQSFYGCKKLESIPKLPLNLKNMTRMCYNCNSLISFPIIPESVNNMTQAFEYCTNLKGNLIINATLTEGYANCFLGASINEDAILTLSGKCALLSELLNTKSASSNISLKNQI